MTNYYETSGLELSSIDGKIAVYREVHQIDDTRIETFYAGKNSFITTVEDIKNRQKKDTATYKSLIEAQIGHTTWVNHAKSLIVDKLLKEKGAKPTPLKLKGRKK